MRVLSPDACGSTRRHQRIHACAECHGARVLKRPQGTRALQYCNEHPLALRTECSTTPNIYIFNRLYLIGNRLVTSVFYKPTDSHSHLLYSSSHPNHTKRSIPFSQFLRLRRLCSEDEDFHTKSLEMTDFFVQRGYPTSVLETAFSKASQIPRSETLTNPVTNVTENNQIPLVLTFHPLIFKLETSLGRIFIF